MAKAIPACGRWPMCSAHPATIAEGFIDGGRRAHRFLVAPQGAAFMGKHIPEHLRRRALRRLWVSNPVLANLDGLLDHAEDFSDAATSAGTVASAYRVGKGMLKHIEALAASAEQTASGTAEGEDETIEDGIAEGEANPEVDAADQAIALPAAEVSASEPVEEHPMPRRHMRFAFAD
ncbi:MAG: DUF3306 domain-containing protein [Rhodobacteraceae bacterium]|nr:DUF3306 domain-containing protein [Paracoccaceae bacterium]